MELIDQSVRSLAIATPLGDNVLGLRAIHVREQLSGGFTIQADLSSTDPDIDFDRIVGHPAAVRLELADGRERYWHALVARFAMTEQSGEFGRYRAILVPWSWALSRSSDCRMFQNLAVPDIIQKIFRDRGAKDFEVRLSAAYPSLEYCVQYRETDFNFVARLMEEQGIAHYFKHDKGKGMLVLADEKAAYDQAEVGATLVYRPGEDKGVPDAVTSWNVELEVQATQFGLSDYNPLKPQGSLLSVAKVGKGHGTNDRQMFEYPGGYSDPREAERLTAIRLDELQSSAEIVSAQTTCLGLGAGHLLSLKEHPRHDQNREYLVTSVDLRIDAGEFSSGQAAQAATSCSFTAIPSSQTFRPPRITPRPVVPGPQPAQVVGPSGEEIYTDEYGRVKVSFYWDRESSANEKSSCWLRVAQGWAGKKWGAFYLPRVGHEVLVEFLEGNPDRPIVTGSVYNAANKPPYALPAEKSKSTLKSLSSKDGGGSNELRFDDDKGHEEVYLHAQKTLAVSVEEDRTEKIGKTSATTVAGKFTLTLQDAAAVTIAKDGSVAGSQEVRLTAKTIVIQADDKITIQVGSSSIVLDQTGISLATDGTLNLKGQQGIEAKSDAKIDLAAQGPLSIKGAIVQVN